MDQEQLIATHKNHLGEIISFQTSSGRIISYRKALLEASNGTLSGVILSENEHGFTSILSPDGETFEQLPNIY